MSEIYTYRPYDESFPELYNKERIYIESALGPYEIQIEHFGSTAVPGLGGKGIIDIYLAVPQGTKEEIFPKLVDIGYSYPRINTPNQPERHFTRREHPDREGEIRTYHLHICDHGYSGFDDCMRFRDHLRNNLKDRLRYEEAKKIAAEQASIIEDPCQKQLTYIGLKYPVIDAIKESYGGCIYTYVGCAAPTTSF